MLSRHHERDVLCPRPFAFGVADGGKVCYSLLSYLPGKSAEEALPGLPETRQFAIGFVAGQELLKLHEVRHPDEDFDWPRRRTAKYRRHIVEARELDLAFDGREQVEGYVDANLDLLGKASIRFQHDDYHAANLIVHEGRFAGVVDFNRFDWGDPVEDFYKLPWFSRPVSTPFARGQVQGYLSGGVPTEFWRRYDLYVAMSLHGSLVWAHRHYPRQLGMFRRRIKEILTPTISGAAGHRPGTWNRHTESILSSKADGGR
jgi:aminoglycoside phosphotransferase (APT) family kinase protein